MYTDLARLYDRLMDDVDYAAWARFYVALIEKKLGRRPLSVFECACGTGSLTAELAQYGFKLTASDLSQEMLEAAAEKLRKRGARVPLVRQDMRALEPPRRVEAIVACCDGVNYLDDEGALEFAKRAYASLKKGGVLAFDVSSLEKLRAMDGQTFCDERDDIAAIWRNSFDENTGLLTMEVSLFVEEESGLYRRMEENHVQKGRPAGEIIRILQEAGFAEISVYGDQTFEEPAPGCARLHFAAVRKD